MKKPTATKTAASPAKRGAGYPALIKAIPQVNTQLVTRVAAEANQGLVLRNWMVGAYIVELEQKDADRAKCRARLLETLAGNLAAEEIRGLGHRMLDRSRKFFLTYPEMTGQISPALLTKPGTKA